jgi:predicted RNA-binding Zn-ribbon protein involved in translation (DUF1610 family)
MEHRCSACGAEIQFEAEKQSLICPFCGTLNEIKRPENTLVTSFDYIVPISVTPQEMIDRVYNYMTTGDFTPDDMIVTSTILLREQFYVPVFVFKVDYQAQWTASFGYNRKEPYTAHRTVSRNGRTFSESYTAYRTVTDWRPASGNDSGVFDIAGYAGNILNDSPLSPIDLVTDESIFENSTVFDRAFTSGFEVETFLVSEKHVYESLQDEIDEIIGENIEEHAQGDKQRDWHWTSQFNYESSTYAVPICHVAFQYNEEEYNVWISGHDPELLCGDELPVDKNKYRTAMLGFIPAFISLITVVIGAGSHRFSDISLIPTIIAFCYGYFRRKSIIEFSELIKNSLLSI